MTPRVVTFGEIMLRLSPPGRLRLTQARSFDALYGGGEANVAVSLAGFGLAADFVTRLPANELGDACLQALRQYNVGTRHLLRGGDRLGIYFLENGASQRGSKVVYDRAGSSFATLQPGAVDWKSVLDGASWFHWTGITPAVSAGAAAVCLEGVRTAVELGLTVSCDLNYRAKLWKWGKAAGEVMEELVALCDLAVANEEDAEKVFGIKAAGPDVSSGRVQADQYRTVCEQLAARFPRLGTIAITLRGSLSASHNTWSAALWRKGEFLTAPTYDIPDIVDRVGGGDSFAAGLIYALNRAPDDPQRALEFAVAASALKHSIFGDFNLVSVDEVEALAAGNASGRVSR
jgi:2-dehydro-3-deoxygluconokinase